MKKAAITYGLTFLFIVCAVTVSIGQLVPKGKYALFVNGGYTYPVSELSNRFNGTYTIDGGVLYGVSDIIGAELRLEYGKFDQLSSHPYHYEVRPTASSVITYTVPPGFESFYRYGAITSSMTLKLVNAGIAKVYVIGGTGIYRHNYFRGAGRSYLQYNRTGAYVLATDSKGNLVTPYKAKRLDQWAWGLNGGVGAGFQVSPNVMLDIKARWEMHFGDLWPALYLGLEEVKPIQIFHLTAGIKFML